MVMEDLKSQSETRQFKAIFPCTLNANEILFGGEVMKWMDEVAYITATRFTRQRMFTINTENIKFQKAVLPNSIIEIVGKIDEAETYRLKVLVEVFAEEMYGLARDKVITGNFIFAAVDEKQHPVRIANGLYMNEKNLN
jgi:acyl-CoA hydrolase